MQKEMNGMMEKLTIAENDKRSAQQASAITWSLHLRVCVRVHAGIKYAYSTCIKHIHMENNWTSDSHCRKKLLFIDHSDFKVQNENHH